MTYVLVETVASKRQGQKLYYRTWAGVGPVLTNKLAVAHRFATYEEAIRSRAMQFSLTYFETEELP